MKIVEVEQGSTEWMSFREGKRTGTTIGKIFAKSRKTGEMYDTDKPLITFYQKVAECLCSAETREHIEWKPFGDYNMIVKRKGKEEALLKTKIKWVATK